MGHRRRDGGGCDALTRDRLRSAISLTEKGGCDMERINAGGIRNFSPLDFVERLIQLKLDQDGLKDVTVRARPIEPEKRAEPAKREA